MRALGGRGKHIQICLCLSTIHIEFEALLTHNEPSSERAQRRSSQRERMRAGYAEAVVCGSRTLELAPNADMGAPRSP